MGKNRKEYATKLKDKIGKIRSEICKNEKNYIEQIEYRRTKIESIEDEIKFRKQEMEKIQQNFNFKIPDYILDEMIEGRGLKNNENLIALINLAVLNGRITKENGKILKQNIMKKESEY